MSLRRNGVCVYVCVCIRMCVCVCVCVCVFCVCQENFYDWTKFVCVVVWCNVVQCVAVCCSVLWTKFVVRLRVEIKRCDVALTGVFCGKVCRQWLFS